MNLEHILRGIDAVTPGYIKAGLFLWIFIAPIIVLLWANSLLVFVLLVISQFLALVWNQTLDLILYKEFKRVWKNIRST